MIYSSKQSHAFGAKGFFTLETMVSIPQFIEVHPLLHCRQSVFVRSLIPYRCAKAGKQKRQRFRWR